jgi:hypothetical protein
VTREAISRKDVSYAEEVPLRLKQQELDDLALSLAVRNNWSPERIVEAKERVRVKKTALEVAFDKSEG